MSDHDGIKARRPHHPHADRPAPTTTPDAPLKIAVRKLNFFYGKHQVLFENDLDVRRNRVMALIGPSGCGKSTHLRVYNRVFEMYRGHHASGEVLLDGHNVLSSSEDVLRLRKRVGMIFQKPSPLPLSIYDNVAFGLRLHYRMGRAEMDKAVEEALMRAALWGEVKDKLRRPGTELSGGQQQRLCIARAIAPEPEVLLMDEPCSSLDPISTRKIEELIESLKQQFTVVIVTHNMQQAIRISDDTAFMYLGRLVEAGTTEHIFHTAQHQETKDYVTGRFG